MPEPVIQVDMYAVGLGAGLMIQYRLPNAPPLRVLADAGMGHGYSADGVLERLPETLSSFDEAAERRIDLVIGTHYDADHLKGLVPILSDDSIEIGAVWLPPLQNDSGDLVGDPSGGSDFLAHQFFESPGDDALLAYLASKQTEIEQLSAFESDVGRASREEVVLRSLHQYWRSSTTSSATEGRDSVAEYERYFEEVERVATAETGGEAPHAADIFNSLVPDAVDKARQALAKHLPLLGAVDNLYKSSPASVTLTAHLLANIRKAKARSAITVLPRLKCDSRPLHSMEPGGVHEQRETPPVLSR